jgi:hypothetical protein
MEEGWLDLVGSLSKKPSNILLCLTQHLVCTIVLVCTLAEKDAEACATCDMHEEALLVLVCTLAEKEFHL